MTRKPYVYLCGNELLMPVNGRRYSTALAISRTGDTEIGFNLHYLNDALRQFRNEERVTVKISGVYTPVVIEADQLQRRQLQQQTESGPGKGDGDQQGSQAPVPCRTHKQAVLSLWLGGRRQSKQIREETP